MDADCCCVSGSIAMLFNSFSFVLLVLGTFCLYYVPCLVRMQVPILIAASFIFYAANQPLLLALLLVSVFANALASYAVRHGNAKCRLAYASLGVGVNLAALIFFKYSPLLGRTLLRSTGSVGEFLLAVPLPVGISFYTFQGISLVVDTLRGDGGRGDGEIVPRSVTKHVTQTVFFIS
ncbi:MAG: MBOAT family protein, partial [Acidobacteria bacterium]|nr:MBOAT family protein [Acidobacteriota bacterium]